MSFSVTMPRLGESVTEGTVTRWLKNEGDQVEADEPLLEVSTDKVDTEIPSPASGVLTSIKVHEDETVEVGVELAVIGDARGDAAAAPAAAAAAPAPAPAAPAPAAPAAPRRRAGAAAAAHRPRRRRPPAPAPAPRAPPPPRRAGRTAAPAPAAPHRAAPAAAAPAPRQPDADARPTADADERRRGRRHLPDPAGAQAGRRARRRPEHRPGHRRRRPDPQVRRPGRAPRRRAGTRPRTGRRGAAHRAAPPRRHRGRAPRAAAARRPSAAARPGREDVADAAGHRRPHGRVAAGVGPADHRRRGRRHQDRPAARSGQARLRGARGRQADVPAVLRRRRASRRSRRTRSSTPRSTSKRRRSPITTPSTSAIAVDTERGLAVPVIHDAGDLNLAGIARKIADLAERTRANKVSPDELGGGTFTLTNTGSRGALFDTPIINQPQVAILGTGTVVKRPVVLNDPNLGETIAIRSMVYLALSYDHRIVDGADAARFLGHDQAAPRGRRLRTRARAGLSRRCGCCSPARPGCIGTRARRGVSRRRRRGAAAGAAARRARRTRSSGTPSRASSIPTALDGVDAVVCLSGAGVGDHRWTPAYRADDPDQPDRPGRHAGPGDRRTRREPPTRVHHRVGVGYYGDTGDDAVDESAPERRAASSPRSAATGRPRPRRRPSAGHPGRCTLRTGHRAGPPAARCWPGCCRCSSSGSAGGWATAGSTGRGSRWPTRSPRSGSC